MIHCSVRVPLYYRRGNQYATETIRSSIAEIPSETREAQKSLHTGAEMK